MCVYNEEKFTAPKGLEWLPKSNGLIEWTVFCPEIQLGATLKV